MIIEQYEIETEKLNTKISKMKVSFKSMTQQLRDSSRANEKVMKQINIEAGLQETSNNWT